MTDWTDEVEDILERLRVNCVNLSEYHRKKFYHYKGFSKYFRIPIIILASINSTASVGLQPVLNQQLISGITCLIGMTMAILGAIELYLGIQSAMELELVQSKEYYTLGIELFKTLNLAKNVRGEDGKDYLNKKYSQYIKIISASNLLTRPLAVDCLTEMPPEFKDFTPKPSPSPNPPTILELPDLSDANTPKGEFAGKLLTAKKGEFVRGENLV